MTAKFKDCNSKTVGKLWETAIKVYACNVIVCIFEISKFDYFDKEQYFSYRKKFVVATIPFYKEQQKSENRVY